MSLRVASTTSLGEGPGRPTDLDLLYAKIPEISQCTGACARSCGPIGYEDAEAQRILRRMRGLPDHDAETLRCSFLNAFGRCDIYSDRPTVCRLWGAVEDMKCVFGCVPDGGVYLTPEEGRALFAEAREARS